MFSFRDIPSSSERSGKLTQEFHQRWPSVTRRLKFVRWRRWRRRRWWWWGRRRRQGESSSQLQFRFIRVLIMTPRGWGQTPEHYTLRGLLLLLLLLLVLVPPNIQRPFSVTVIQRRPRRIVVMMIMLQCPGVYRRRTKQEGWWGWWGYRWQLPVVHVRVFIMIAS